MLLVSLQMVKHTGDFGLCILNSGLCILSRSERCTLKVLLGFFFLEMKEAWMLLCVREWVGGAHACCCVTGMPGFYFCFKLHWYNILISATWARWPLFLCTGVTTLFLWFKGPTLCLFLVVFLIDFFPNQDSGGAWFARFIVQKSVDISKRKKPSIFSPAFAASSERHCVLAYC